MKIIKTSPFQGQVQIKIHRQWDIEQYFTLFMQRFTYYFPCPLLVRIKGLNATIRQFTHYDPVSKYHLVFIVEFLTMLPEEGPPRLVLWNPKRPHTKTSISYFEFNALAFEFPPKQSTLHQLLLTLILSLLQCSPTTMHSISSSKYIILRKNLKHIDNILNIFTWKFLQMLE